MDEVTFDPRLTNVTPDTITTMDGYTFIGHDGGLATATTATYVTGTGYTNTYHLVFGAVKWEGDAVKCVVRPTPANAALFIGVIYWKTAANVYWAVTTGETAIAPYVTRAIVDCDSTWMFASRAFGDVCVLPTRTGFDVWDIDLASRRTHMEHGLSERTHAASTVVSSVRYLYLFDDLQPRGAAYRLNGSSSSYRIDFLGYFSAPNARDIVRCAIDGTTLFVACKDRILQFSISDPESPNYSTTTGKLACTVSDFVVIASGKYWVGMQEANDLSPFDSKRGPLVASYNTRFNILSVAAPQWCQVAACFDAPYITTTELATLTTATDAVGTYPTSYSITVGPTDVDTGGTYIDLLVPKTDAADEGTAATVEIVESEDTFVGSDMGIYAHVGASKPAGAVVDVIDQTVLNDTTGLVALPLRTRLVRYWIAINPLAGSGRVPQWSLTYTVP